MGIHVNTNKTILKFPVKIGEEKNVEEYSKKLINGEEQLLITRDGKFYLTNGNGSFKKIYNGSEDIIYKIKEIIDSINNCDEKIEKVINESILNIDNKIGNFENLNDFFKDENNLIQCLNKLKDELNESSNGFGGQAPSVNDLNDLVSLRSFSKHSSIPEIGESLIFDSKDDLPILFGKESDVELYSTLLTTRERQLLITEDTGKIFLTDGNGSYVSIYNGKVTASNVNIKIPSIEHEISIEEAFEKLLNNELKAKENNITGDCVIGEFIIGE